MRADFFEDLGVDVGEDFGDAEQCGHDFFLLGMKWLVGGEPIFSGAEFDEDGDVVREGEGGLHGVEDFWDEFFLLGGVEVEDEFVVDLEEHAGVVGGEECVDFDHGEFDHVGGGALDGGVDGGAFGVAADVLIGAVDVGEVAAAAAEGCDVALLAGEGDGVVHEFFYAWVLEEVVFDEFGGIGAGDAESLG